MLDDSVWSKSNETHINTLRKRLVTYFLDAGCNVIIDDTNCKTRAVEELRAFVAQHGKDVEFKVKVFDTELAVCLVRNGKRTGAAFVPENIIRKFHADLHGPEGLGGESGEEFDQEFVS